jgi:glutathione S-transferase
MVHDSLAIFEFLAESHPELPLWPRDRRLRALARSVVAEFHSGFGNIRNSYHTTFFGVYEGKVMSTPGIDAEVARLLDIFEGARRETEEWKGKEENGKDMDEGFLYGQFGIADAVFWPVLWVFPSYIYSGACLVTNPVDRGSGHITLIYPPRVRERESG